MLQQRKNDFAVKNVTNPVRSNVFRGSLRWGEDLFRQRDAKTAMGWSQQPFDLSA
jgi:hypothetical protein